MGTISNILSLYAYIQNPNFMIFFLLEILYNKRTIVAVFSLFLFKATQVFAQSFFPAEQAESFYSDIPENFKLQIRNAVPKKSIAEPENKRKLLVINFNIRDREVTAGHPSIPYANYAIYQMGEQTGAFETFFSNDTTVFEKGILDQFDGIVLNNTVGVLFEDLTTRQHLLDYVYSGKGIMGIHGGAGATFVQYPVYDQFPEFGEMMGGYENGGHPWKTHEWINLIVEEPEHQLASGFESLDFNISDEIYQYTAPYSRDHLRILLSVNTEKTDMGDQRHFLPERKLDNDFPVSWIRAYGKGRVFNTSLGHHPHINWDGRILDHNFRAIQFILGDLPVPTTPNNKLTSSIIAQEKLGWKLGLATYTFRENTLFETIDKAAELGIWYLDGWNEQKVSAEIDKPFDHNLEKQELLTIRRKLLEKDVRIVNFYIHDIPADETECKRIFEFGKFLGIEAFISEPDPKALDIIEKYCKEFEIKLAIHNHGKDISPHYWDPGKLLELVEHRSEWIGACGDLGYWTRSGIDPHDAINTLNKRIITLQIHDLDNRTKDGHDVPWGEGIQDLMGLFSLLNEQQIKPTLMCLEYSYNWGKSMPEIVKSKRFFDQTVIQLAATHP